MATRIPLYQVSAFADGPFSGNPAAVCPLERWLPAAVMQGVASENNLSETAFFVARDDGAYDLRWFTPAVEVELCGHATLAAGAVVLDRLRPGHDAVTFHSASGPLGVARRGERFALDFPSLPPRPIDAPHGLVEALGREPVEVLHGHQDHVAVYETESDVRALAPDFRALRAVEARGVIATAPGESCDFVSRFFAPRAGIDEDPATGSAHCVTAPYWGERLGRDELRALQLSERVGTFHCTLRGERVEIAGRVVPFLEGTIELP